MSRRLAAMLVGVVALALIAAGCGSGDEGALTKAEFVEQGDTLCKEIASEYESEYEAFAKAQGIGAEGYPNKTQSNEIAENIYFPSIEKRLEALRELNPSEAEKKKVEAILDASQDGLAKAEEKVALMFGFDGYPFDEANELASKYGFKVCYPL